MTAEGGLFQKKEDTHPVWGLRSVNWHAGDSDRIQDFGDNQTANANTDHKAKAETQSYSPAVWGGAAGFTQIDDDVPANEENIQLGKFYTTFDEDANVDDHGY